MSIKKATILVDHGSRNPKAHDEFESLYLKLKEKLLGVSLFYAHMEISEPLLQDELLRLSSEGYTEIKIVPLFYFNGKHLSKDIPNIINEVKLEFPDSLFELEPAMGKDDFFIAYLFNRLKN